MLIWAEIKRLAVVSFRPLPSTPSHVLWHRGGPCPSPTAPGHQAEPAPRRQNRGPRCLTGPVRSQGRPRAGAIARATPHHTRAQAVCFRGGRNTCLDHRRSRDRLLLRDWERAQSGLQRGRRAKSLPACQEPVARRVSPSKPTSLQFSGPSAVLPGSGHQGAGGQGPL